MISGGIEVNNVKIRSILEAKFIDDHIVIDFIFARILVPFYLFSLCR